MGVGVALSEDLRGVLIYMHTSRNLEAKAISMLTGIPLRTVYRVLSTWKRTGEVKPAPEGKRGRPRALDFADTQVSKVIFVLTTMLTTISQVPCKRCNPSQR